MSSFEIKKLAVPVVCVLIAFLAYSSQYLLRHIDPGPLDRDELIKINLLAGCIWICYAKACLTDPGRVPRGWKPPTVRGKKLNDDDDVEGIVDEPLFTSIYSKQRWCRKCEAFKPPRAHHCKTCQRCIPKMDHHCPWTGNCVSHFTFPHFMRFLFYAVVGMGYLERLLLVRVSIIWKNRNMPSYYGPSTGQFAHLFILVIVNSMVLFMLVILLLRTAWMLALNQTTIEGWEIERHHTLVRRARALGGFLDGPDGMRIRIRKQEFPYDIGIWQNIKQGMGGTGNVYPSTPWPPPDPDRIPRRQPSLNPRSNPLLVSSSASNRGLTSDSIAAFRERQQADLLRWRQRPFHERYRHHVEDDLSVGESGDESSGSGEEGWRTAEGDRLRDFGVDEDVEFYDYEVDERDYGYRPEGDQGAAVRRAGDDKAHDEEEEDDIPLAKLIEKRRMERERENARATEQRN
ncbi:hypothetical protein VTO42DRAFT_4892 [Malbranchea cinnamomea]